MSMPSLEPINVDAYAVDACSVNACNCSARNNFPHGKSHQTLLNYSREMPATDMKKARATPLLVHSSLNQCQNGYNVHGYIGKQGWV